MMSPFGKKSLKFLGQFADGYGMSPLPKFHAKANKDAEARRESALDERARAERFLDSLDDLLNDASEKQTS